MTQWPQGAIALAIALALLWGQQPGNLGWIWLLGCAIGALLVGGRIGFSGPIRRFIGRGEVEGLAPLAALLALLIPGSALLIVLAEPLGLNLRTTQAPISITLVAGAFLFGMGMQLARRCASGTLACAAQADREFVAMLLALTTGVFLGSLHRPFWERVIPAALPPVVLLDRLPLALAVLAQMGLLALCVAIAMAVRRIRQRHIPSTSSPAAEAGELVASPRAVVGLALLLLLLFGVSGEPWKVLWGFALSAAHGAKSLGWDPQDSAFWASPSRLALLSEPGQWLRHGAVVVNLGVIYGAWLAGRRLRARTPSGRSLKPSAGWGWRQGVGGLLMGYGGFLSYGCNISSFLGGVMSFSLHGWVWLFAALTGSAFWLYWERKEESARNLRSNV